jgi:F-type H+-transporting ATPase subunit b
LDFLGKVINFVVLVGGLIYLLRSPLGNFLEGRTRSLDHALRDAKDSRVGAEKRQQEIEDRLKKIGREMEHIRREAETEGKMIQERILQEAKAGANRLKLLSRQEIEMLAQAGIREIKQYAAELAIALAQEKIQSKIKKEDQSLLIDRSIERLEKIYEKSNPDQEIHPRTH